MGPPLPTNQPRSTTGATPTTTATTTTLTVIDTPQEADTPPCQEEEEEAVKGMMTVMLQVTFLAIFLLQAHKDLDLATYHHQLTLTLKVTLHPLLTELLLVLMLMN